jgi:hypothetical protein
VSDAPHPSGNDRLAIYAVTSGAATGSQGGTGPERRRIAETSVAGLGTCLMTLRAEGEFDNARVGVFDREARVWLISPWATSPWIPTGDD